jgi:hypothetical protein
MISDELLNDKYVDRGRELVKNTSPLDRRSSFISNSLTGLMTKVIDDFCVEFIIHH